MRPFKKIITKQVVQFNSEKPESQVVTKEDITTVKFLFWGLIVIHDIKDITQKFGADSKKPVGF